MHAAGVVADHSAQVAVLVRGRIWPKSEIELVGAFTQMVEHNPGLHPRVFLLCIEFQDLVEIFGKIYDPPNVAKWSGKTGPATPCQNRSAVVAGQSHSLNHVLNCFGNHDTDRYLALVGSIIGIKRAAAFIKSDFAADAAAQISSQRFCAIPRELVRSSARTAGKFPVLGHG